MLLSSMMGKRVRNLLHSHVNISALLFFIASFALPAIHANAQETLYRELSISSGNMIYTQPETRNHDGYSAVAWREYDASAEGKCCTFSDTEFARTRTETSNSDGLTRKDEYFKMGFGYLFNQSPTPTTFFSTLGTGIIWFAHNVKGVNRWRSDSDMRYDDNILYEELNFYLQVEFGLKMQNRHTLSFYYIKPILQQNLIARNTSDSFLGIALTGGVNDSVAAQGNIVDGMVGFRYSYIFPSYQKAVPAQPLHAKLYINEDTR
ncbi:MAG: hypothetical protein K0U45_09130 [Alphaproteobacteria bacterium]|nr:hypothetical protein [Alphaproteobacteria bacterium]